MSIPYFITVYRLRARANNRPNSLEEGFMDDSDEESSDNRRR